MLHALPWTLHSPPLTALTLGVDMPSSQCNADAILFPHLQLEVGSSC